MEHQITSGPGGRILTNIGVWSPDSAWIVYDTRSDAAGERFDGSTIEMVNVASGEVRVLYHAREGAHCGAATFDPRRSRVAFILGPERPTPAWQYGPFHRQGVIVDTEGRGATQNLDARDVAPPFTPGALRGGSHVHVWDAAGEWVSFTYEDHVLAQAAGANRAEPNQRNVGVSAPLRPVRVPRTHPRNHDGGFFSVVVTRTVATPQRGSDQIARACEEGWVGTNGYVRSDGTRQRRALAFQGQVTAVDGRTFYEVFLVDLPETLTVPGEGPLEGTTTTLPRPPHNTQQRRLTFTAHRPHPGLQGPRHWLRVRPDGSQIACLMKDDAGVVQLWTVPPSGGPPRQVTHNPWPIASAFTWSPDGRWIAHVMDQSVCATDVVSGKTHRLTAPADTAAHGPRPEACVVSPDGRRVAFVRRLPSPEGEANQICVVDVELPPRTR